MHIDLTSTTARRLTAAALVTGPTVVMAGMAATPWESEGTTAAYHAALAASPVQAQWAALLLFLGYALLGLTAAAVLVHATAAPRRLRIATGVLTFMGATLLPGLVVVDFYDLALAQSLPAGQAVAVADKAQSYGVGVAFQLPAVAGLVLGSIGLALCAWRGRLVGGWAPLAILAGMALPATGRGPASITISAALMLLVYVAVAVRIARPAGGGVVAAPRIGASSPGLAA